MSFFSFNLQIKVSFFQGNEYFWKQLLRQIKIQYGGLNVEQSELVKYLTAIIDTELFAQTPAIHRSCCKRYSSKGR